MSYRERSPRGHLVTMALGIVVLLGMAALALDVAMLYTVRNQLQNAADGAALAGASGLLVDQAEAQSRAIAIAGANTALGEPVVISPEDVTFPTERRVRAITHRAQDTADPVPLLFARVLGQTTADVRALAEAEIFSACGSDCFKPWSVADRFFDGDTNGVYNPENGVDYYDRILTGYRYPQDVGLQVTLKESNPQQAIEPGIFYPVDFPPINKGTPIPGGNQYRENIATCNPSLIEIGDTLQLEPGNMIGPTQQGIDALLAQDPGAYWSDGEIAGSLFPGFTSPRVVKIALFNPDFPPSSGRNYVIVSNLVAFFLEGTPGNDVLGRFVNITDPGAVACEDPDAPSFIVGLRLVR